MKEETLDLSLDGVSSILDSAKPIPFKFIGWQIFISLSKKLDPDKLVNGNDWRMLAEKLGYTTEEIIVFESKQSNHGSNTIKVLTDYCHTKDSTVNNLYSALESIDRPDALDELRQGLPEIQRRYMDSFHKKHSHHEMIVENDCACPSCDRDMSMASDKYNSFCYEQKKFMNSMDNNHYSMLMNSHPLHMPVATGNKHYQRHKSLDNSLMMEEMNSRMHGYERPSPEFKRMRSVPMSDSMMVRGHDGRSQYFREMEPMDHAPTLRDDPVSPARVMMRDLRRYNHPGGLTGNLPTMCHSKDYDTSYQHQYSQRSGLKLEIPSPMDGYKHQIQDNFCSPSPTPTSTPSAPLVQLTKLANEKKFQPDEAYNDLMRLKQEEEIQMKKAGYQQAQIDDMDKMGTSSSHQMQGTGPGMGSKMRPIKMEDGRTKSSEPPNTFPLRLKSSVCVSNSSQLIKSASLPNNMKPAEFKKTFRHIKVFVTYATDDKKHTQRVINLCNCLAKNGFTCCVDIFNKSIQDEDPSTWCVNRFDEADFVLAVMSPKYRREVDSCEMDNDADDSDSMDEDDRQHGSKSYRLHTKQIYRLMYREYLQNNQRTGRFVPLLFQGMSSNLIPEWMMYAYSKLVYIWPEQYKDLLWMLTKPENRVPEHIAPVINRSLQNTSEEKENGEALEVSHESE